MNAHKPLDRELLTFALDTYSREYQDLSDTWKQVDAKAQGAVTIAGIFLAATYSLLQHLSGADCTHRYLLIGTVLSLIMTVLAALRVLWTRSVDAPPWGKGLHREMSDLLALGAEKRAEDLEGLYKVAMERWKNVVEAVDKANHTKADSLLWSQRFLALAIILASVVTIRIALRD